MAKSIMHCPKTRYYGGSTGYRIHSSSSSSGNSPKYMRNSTFRNIAVSFLGAEFCGAYANEFTVYPTATMELGGKSPLNVGREDRVLNASALKENLV